MLASLLAASLAACTSLEGRQRPFQDAPAPAISDITASPTVMVAPVGGPPPEVGRVLAELVADSLRERDVIAVTRNPPPGSLLLTGHAEVLPEGKDHALLRVAWSLTQPDGLTTGTFQSQQTIPVIPGEDPYQRLSASAFVPFASRVAFQVADQAQRPAKRVQVASAAETLPAAAVPAPDQESEHATAAGPEQTDPDADKQDRAERALGLRKPPELAASESGPQHEAKAPPPPVKTASAEKSADAPPAATPEAKPTAAAPESKPAAPPPAHAAATPAPEKAATPQPPAAQPEPKTVAERAAKPEPNVVAERAAPAESARAAPPAETKTPIKLAANDAPAAPTPAAKEKAEPGTTAPSAAPTPRKPEPAAPPSSAAPASSQAADAAALQTAALKAAMSPSEARRAAKEGRKAVLAEPKPAEQRVAALDPRLVPTDQAVAAAQARDPAPAAKSGPHSGTTAAPEASPVPTPQPAPAPETNASAAAMPSAPISSEAPPAPGRPAAPPPAPAAAQMPAVSAAVSPPPASPPAPAAQPAGPLPSAAPPANPPSPANPPVRTARLEAAVPPAAPANPAAPAALGPVSAIIVAPVQGAPGNGNAALTQAIKDALRQSGLQVADYANPQTVVLHGRVKVAPAGPGSDSVGIEWALYDAAGHFLGTVNQHNQLPRSLTQGRWDKTAGMAARSAVAGIRSLIGQARAASSAG